MHETEGVKGLHVRDYRFLDLEALEEIRCLDEQLTENLEEIKSAVNGTNSQALWLLSNLIDDNNSHRDYCVKCEAEILDAMECHEASTHFEDYMNEPTDESVDRLTPCDYPDNDGHYHCPFDSNGSDDCRNYCGLGVDE